MEPRQEDPTFRIEVVKAGLVRVTVVDPEGNVISSFLLRVVPDSVDDKRRPAPQHAAPA